MTTLLSLEFETKDRQAELDTSTEAQTIMGSKTYEEVRANGTKGGKTDEAVHI